MEYVDLGLPSGNLWAKHLIGMKSDTDVENALYFQWGAEIGYHKDEEFDFSKENYDYSQINWTLFGGGIELPTEDDFQELLNNTEHEVEVVNGVKGMFFTSKSNRNCLFVPFIGYRNGSDVYGVGDNVGLWSSSLDVYDHHHAVELYADIDGNDDIINGNRCYGYGVLGIEDKNIKRMKDDSQKCIISSCEEITLKERFWENGNIFLMSTGGYRMVYEDKLMDAHGYIYKGYISEDLENRDSVIGERVVKVYSPNKNACYLKELLEPSEDRLLWKLSDNIMTIEEIEKKLGIENLIIVGKKKA